MRVAWVSEQTSGAPEEFFAGGFLETEQVIGDFFQSCVGLPEIAKFWSDVAVVPAVVIDADFIEKLEKDIGSLEGVGNGIALIIPRHEGGRATEGIGETVTHHVPVSGSEAAMIFHGFSSDDFVGIVLLESEWVFRFRTFVLYFRDVREVGHG